MADAHKNFATSLVATAPSPASSGTSLVVTGGEGTRFPTVPFNATVCPAAADPTLANAEIVRVTAISTDTFTITRATESSSARTVVVGDRIFAGPTDKTFRDIETQDGHFQNWYPGTAKAVTNPGFQARYLSGTLTSGILSLHALSRPLRAGVTLTSITFLCNVAGGGMTHQWFTLVNKADLKTLRSTTDDTSTAWSVNTLKTLNLSSTYTPTSDIDAYVGVLVTGSTMPTTYGPEVMSQLMTASGLLLAGNSSTGLTTPVADGTTVSALTAASSFATAWVS
jgi:hypothetical protein